MLDPYLVEESTPFRLAPALEDLAQTLGEDAIHHDYMMVLLIAIMAEAGFYVTVSPGARIDSTKCSRRTLATPESCKRSPVTGNYNIKFSLCPGLPERESKCKLVAIPSGDILVVNLILEQQKTMIGKRGFNIAVQTAKYVNVYSSDLTGRYLNLKELSFRYKNAISTPAMCEILSAAGLPNPNLSGLPAEIILRIMSMLDTRSLCRMQQTSRVFRELAGDPKLWKNRSRQLINNCRSIPVTCSGCPCFIKPRKRHW